MKILVAEDHPLILQSIVWKLRKAGHEIVGAVDGRQAMEFYETEQPDLVLTDIYMPFVTGQELINYIRTEKGDKTPVIVLSQNSMEADKVSCFDLGADDYVTKPYLPNELVARINRFAA